MSTDWMHILVELQSLARQRGWDPVAALAADLLANRAAAVLVAAPADVDPTSFQRWVTTYIPDSTVTVLPLEQLAQDPLPAVKASKAIAFFQCGSLIGADAVDGLVQAFFSRPSPSYAIVLGNAGCIEGEEDLALIERGAWRLLVPGPKPDWRHQDLLAHGCYLWSDSQPSAFLQQRLQRDMDALVAWLRTPLAHRDELARLQVLCALDLAEDFIYRSQTSAPQEALPPAQQLVATRDALAALRRRLIRRLDADAESIERQLTASLQTLEQDLLHDVRPYLQKRVPPQSVASTDMELLRTIIVEYITTNAEHWRSQAEQLLSLRSREIVADIETLLQSMDWSFVNAVAARNGDDQAYPEALLHNLMVNTEFRLLYPGSSDGSLISALQQVTDRRTVVGTTIAGALAGAGVLAATTYVLGFGPVGLVAAGAAAMLSGQIVKGQLERGQILALCETHARLTIATVIHEAIAAVRQYIRQSVGLMSEYIAGELKALEALLDQTLDEARHPADQRVAPDPDRKILAEYRRRIIPER
jgi:hypothetical protein